MHRRRASDRRQLRPRVGWVPPGVLGAQHALHHASNRLSGGQHLWPGLRGGEQGIDLGPRAVRGGSRCRIRSPDVDMLANRSGGRHDLLRHLRLNVQHDADR